MATAAAAKPKEFNYAWEGKDKSGKQVKGEMRAGGEAIVNATLRRQGMRRVWVSGPGFSPRRLWVTSRVCAGSPSLVA